MATLSLNYNRILCALGALDAVALWGRWRLLKPALHKHLLVLCVCSRVTQRELEATFIPCDLVGLTPPSQNFSFQEK